MAIFRNNNVVNQLDADKSPCIPELVGYSNVLAAWLKRSGWMIMDTDNGGSPVRDRIGKNLPGVYKTMIEQAECYGPYAKDLPGTIQGNADEMLLPFIL